MALSGHKIELNITGAAIALTDEACTEVSGTVFQITDTAKRVLDPTATFTVDVDAVPEPAANWTLNRLTGTITFTSSQTGSTVTIDGTGYLPLSAAGEANSISISNSANNADVTTFASAQASGGYVKRLQQLKDVSIEIGGFYVDETFFDDLVAGNLVVVEFWTDYGNSDPDIRAWMLPSADNLSASADAPVEESLSFEGAQDAEGNVIAYVA
jgi:hypothetical protein